jgi:glycosyltransferase involved in cell wall biosynthesis
MAPLDPHHPAVPQAAGPMPGAMNVSQSCSVIIPVYNGEETLPELVERLAAVLPALCTDYEAILLNDGSLDRSWEVIQRLAQSLPWVVGINLMRNYGQHNALLCGVRAARCSVCVTMDDDLQHPPEEIGKLLATLAEGYDVVYGLPLSLPHSLWRNFFSRLIKRLLAFVMGVPNLRDIGAFRALRTDLRQAFADYQNPNVILDVLLSWGTTSFGSVRVSEDQRASGASNYSIAKLVQVAIMVLTGYSTAPLRLASQVGLFATVVGLAIFVYVVVEYFVAGSVPGFPFLASIISVMSGVQLFALGIFGEYLARMFDRSMDRPTYVIRQKTRQ